MKKPNLSAAFTVGEQPILSHEPPVVHRLPQPRPTPKRRDHRENRQAFTCWLDRDLVAQLRALSRDLVVEHGRAGNSIEALVTEGIEHVLSQRSRG